MREMTSEEEISSEDFKIFKDKYLSWFHKNCHFNTKWLGRQTIKNPFDVWVYQEIIFETKPTVIIEIGNYAGGSIKHLHIHIVPRWPNELNFVEIIGKTRPFIMSLDSTLELLVKYKEKFSNLI